MTVAEYAKRTTAPHMTFIKARARKDAHTPFYHPEDQTTPLYYTFEVEQKNILSDYIVLNDKQESITWLSGADWNNWIRKGMARCLLVISPDDMQTLYPGKQGDEMVEYIEKKLDL